MKYLLTLISLSTLFFTSFCQANMVEFPGRQQFPDVKIYSKADLNNNFNSVQIVDTRSAYEFETIHINHAVNIPVSSKDFVKKLRELRKSTNKPIVFYCNGRSCFKSYKASKTAMENNINNVYAYDAGMFEWATSYPDKASLLGHSPLNPKDILNKNTLKAHMLSPKKFSEMIYTMADKARVLDIRDLTQRSNGIGYFVGIEYWISLNNKNKVLEFIRKAARENKTLFIYDGVGKQVRWLQYSLEKANIKNYFFMDKGADGFYDQIINVKN
ncbi:MAG: rhodanese-like domain-containing protein [Gammaproteobacteria bacterium]|nr:rhodanese-like domain-containing protein [Gammaproteobacteria bacterium]